MLIRANSSAAIDSERISPADDCLARTSVAPEVSVTETLSHRGLFVECMYLAAQRSKAAVFSVTLASNVARV